MKRGARPPAPQSHDEAGSSVAAGRVPRNALSFVFLSSRHLAIAPLSVLFVLYVPSLPEICGHPRNLQIKIPRPSGSLRGLKVKTPSQLFKQDASRFSLANPQPSTRGITHDASVFCKNFAGSSSVQFARKMPCLNCFKPITCKARQAKRAKKILIFFAVIYITYHWEIMRKPAKKCRRIVAKTRNL